MTLKTDLPATLLPISECFRGASIGFAFHKKRRQYRKGGRRKVKWNGKKPKSRTGCHFHAQKVVREQGITGFFGYFCAGLRQLYPRHAKNKKKRYAVLVIWKRRKFSNLAQGRHSGSHAIAWAAITISVLKVFPTTSKSECGSIAVPRFPCFYKLILGTGMINL